MRRLVAVRALRLVLWLALGVALLGCGGAASSAGVGASRAQPEPPSEPLTIAFGSCSSLDREQRLWVQLLAQDPDVFVWLGDIVYADTEDMTHMRALYDELKAYPPYAVLRAQTRVIGTWDDHDYGRNNAGREYPMREQSQRELLDFLDEPNDSPRRAQQGVYAAYDLGEDPYRVRVVLLDLRYHREPPGPSSDMLGEAQWRWLEQQLNGSTAAVHVLGSSIQLVAGEHPYESWSQLPASRERLLALLDRLKPHNLVVLSGDRHLAELSIMPRPNAPDVVDFTSSGLSREVGRPLNEPNRYRVGEQLQEVNFGLVRIDFRAREIRLRAMDAAGAARIEHTLPLR